MSKRFSVAPASSLRMAFEQDKHTALLKHRRSMERIAELMRMKPGTLYDWLEELRMPVHALPAWEHAIGALIGFSEGRVEAEETMAALLGAIGALAWQRENVSKANQPELDLELAP